MQKETNNLENIRIQINLIKERLNFIDKTLVVQEKLISDLSENTKSLLKDALGSGENTVTQIMAKQFRGKQLPGILSDF